MTRQILSTLKITALAFILAVGVSYALAWTGPSVAAPGSNVDAPINVGATPQTKVGPLTVGSLTTAGDIQVGNQGAACAVTNSGAIHYNSASNKLEFCNGSAWKELAEPTSVPIGTKVTYPVTGVVLGELAFDGTNMWSVNSAVDSVTKISPAGNMTTYSGTGDYPYNIAFIAGNIWTTNWTGKSVTKISPTTGGVMGTYPIPSTYGAGDIAFDGTDLLVTTAGWFGVTGNLYKLSLAGNVIDTYSGTYGSAMAFDGTNMWTLDGWYNRVYKISPIGTKVTYTTPAWPMSIAFDGTNMWTANFSADSVSKISPSGTVTSWSVGDAPVDIAFDGTGYMWVTNFGGNSVTRISSTGTKETYGGFNKPSAIAYDDNGSMWVVNSGNNTVTKIQAI